MIPSGRTVVATEVCFVASLARSSARVTSARRRSPLGLGLTQHAVRPCRPVRSVGGRRAASARTRRAKARPRRRVVRLDAPQRKRGRLEDVETSRRDTFSEYIRRFNPTADPAVALAQKFYVPSPEGTAARLASRFAIDGSSTHLVLGGIGSGKTTELLALKDQLDTLGGIRGLFVDVPSVQKASSLRDGVLLAHAWDAISRSSKKDGRAPGESEVDHEDIDKIVNGYWEDRHHPFGDEDGDFVRVSGLISPPERDSRLERLEKALASRCATAGDRFVILFDGLDRVPLSQALSNMILGDAAALARAGIGCVIVGPQGLRLGVYRQIVERFTSFHLQGADASAESGRAFLESVLAARARNEILPPEVRSRLAEWCGGLVRDLISLARDAGQAAYEAGADRIESTHVDSAADRFGRSLLLGLSPAMANRVLELRQRRDSVPVEFTATNEVDVELLSLRLIIEVPGAPVRYILHPTVRPLLGGLRKTA